MKREGGQDPEDEAPTVPGHDASRGKPDSVSSTPGHDASNVSDLPRKLIWMVYKYGRDELTPFVELRTTDAFAQRQVDPLRRRLCGLAPLPETP